MKWIVILSWPAFIGFMFGILAGYPMFAMACGMLWLTLAITYSFFGKS